MKKENILKLNKDFRRLYARGNSAVGGTVVVYAMKNRSGSIRAGITVGKVVGNAVKRNRAKRLLRAAFDVTVPCMQQGFDYVIVARTRINGKKMGQAAHDLKKALIALNLYIPDGDIQ